ncbi:MAG: uracil-DNA glycosylase family protein [Anaerolineae bacterium]
MTELENLANQVAQCRRCALAQGRTNAVPGEGPADARLMFIGEAPGYHEDRLGRPFVGAAGQFLEQLLHSIGMARQQVYICNVIKCRPPNNRDPLPEEIEACRVYLDRQIELIKPKVIVTLGRYSMARYFPSGTISQIHGRPARVGDILCLPLFHPAAALHQPRYKAAIEEDFRKIPDLLKQMAVEPQASANVNAQQLSLF